MTGFTRSELFRVAVAGIVATPLVWAFLVLFLTVLDAGR